MKETKKYRYNHFQVVINLYDPDTTNFSLISDSELVPIMKKTQFVTQKALENLLLDAQFMSRESGSTNFSDFSGQLERGSEKKRPHWQLFLKTRLKTTASKVHKYLCQQLYGVDSNPTILVTEVKDVEESTTYVIKSGRLILESSDWYPGFISKRIAEANRILEDDDLMREIHEGKTRRPFQTKLIDLVKSVPDDRTVNWVACFSGNSGKSKLTKYLVTSGLAISVNMDSSRSMSKTLILKARNYQNIYGCPPPCVIIDQERQVRGDFLEGFYAILEGIKNGIVESGFQCWDSYSWGNKNVHVIVLSNTAPQYNFLSTDRYKVFEILPKEFNFDLRSAIINPILVKYDGRNVQYRYQSSSTEIEEADTEPILCCEDKEKKMKIQNYMGLSALITQSEFTIPEHIRALILEENEKRNQSKKH